MSGPPSPRPRRPSTLSAYRPPPPGFDWPVWTGSLDTEARLRAVPADATVKGWVLRAAVDAATGEGAPAASAAAAVGAGGPHDGFVRFRDYPLRQHVERLAQLARLVAPGAPRLGLRRLGARVFEAYAGSTLGKVSFAFAATAEQPVRVGLDAAIRGYDTLGRGAGRAELVELVPGQYALVRLVGVWAFPESYQVGVIGRAVTMAARAALARGAEGHAAPERHAAPDRDVPIATRTLGLDRVELWIPLDDLPSDRRAPESSGVRARPG